MPAEDLQPQVDPDDPSARLARVRDELDELAANARALSAGVGQPGADLVPARSADPVAAKRQMAAVRAQAQKTAVAIREKREEMEALMRAEMDRAAALLGPMEALMEHLNQGIQTVNLYLGADEEIVLLRDGESAPAEQPIVLRQMLLFMDEECAAQAEEGGIRPVDIETFDEWLLADPAHLDQVLPETKGIVALRPRRHAHRERWEQGDTEANKRTYWLVRNGERVYRTLTTLELRDRILPYSDEFDRLFSRTVKGMRVPLRPGSYEWEKAQDAASDAERTYMRVGLVLEGLLHRTPIFHPLPPQGVSFLDPMCVRDGRVRYITDAEGLLGTGQESFEAWRRRLCGELRVGMRIIIGDGLKDLDYERRPGNPRLSPTIANLPATGVVHVIEERKPGGALVFRYHEGTRYVGDGAWGGGEYREPKRRASCTVKPSDAFVIPFDLATVRDMQRFLTARTDRHHYADMFPILKAAIAAKQREAQVEAPFRTMLAGVLARENGVSVQDAQDVVPELVDWFKLKNKYHRPLLPQAARPDQDIPDDEVFLTATGRPLRGGRAAEARAQARAARQRAVVEAAEAQEQGAKAVRMIVAEHKRRLADQRRGADPALVAQLRAAHPHALLIARPRRAGYVVLDPAEPTKDVYCHETHYTSAGERKDRTEWVLPGPTRHKQWMVVHASERWAAWDLHADEREHLRGPERDRLVELVLAEARESGSALAVAFDKDREFTAWHLRADADVHPDRLLSAGQQPPKVSSSERTWKREQGDVVLTPWGYEREGARHRAGDLLPWEELAWQGSYDDTRENRVSRHRVIWRDETRIGHLEAEQDRYLTVVRAAGPLRDRARALTDSVEAQWLRAAWAAERARFDEDFGDEDLWDAHKKSKERAVRFPHIITRYAQSHDRPTTLGDAVEALVQAGVDPEGWTVKRALDEATERFGETEAQASKRFDGDPDRYVYTAAEDLHAFVLRAGDDAEDAA